MVLTLHPLSLHTRGAAPRLDIQSPEYIAASLEAFRQRTRASGTMIAAANQLSDQQIAELSAYYGRLVEVEPAASEGLGAEVAARGIPERDIAACASCHESGRPEFPRLAGQDRDYLERQLHLFNEHGLERGGHRAEMMAKATDAVHAMVRQIRDMKDLEKIKNFNDRLQLVELEADKYMNELLRDIYGGKYDALRAMVIRDVNELMEKVVDRCHDTGNVIMHIVLKNS